MRASQIVPGNMYAWGHRSLTTMRPVRVLETVRYWEHPYGRDLLTPSFPDEPLKEFSHDGDVYRGLLCAASRYPSRAGIDAVSRVLRPHLSLSRPEAAAQITRYARDLPEGTYLRLIAPNRIVRPWAEHEVLCAEESSRR